MDIKKLAVFLKENGIPAFRLKQAREAVYKNYASSWDEITGLPAPLRDRLMHGPRVLSVETLETLIS